MDGHARLGINVEDQQPKPNIINTTTTLPGVWAAFDTFQLCYTVIPQAKHYYRYGTFRDCSKARQDLLFAMSLKTKSQTEAEVFT